MSGDFWGTLFLLVLYGLCIAIWWIHRIAAWALLLFFRDAFVHLIGWHTSEKTERLAVIHWLIFVPLLIFVIWCAVVTSELSRSDRFIPMIISLPIGATSAGFLVLHYLKLYAEKPVYHASWPRFVASAVELGLQAKLTYVEAQFHIKRWWRRKK